MQRQQRARLLDKLRREAQVPRVGAARTELAQRVEQRIHLGHDVRRARGGEQRLQRLVIGEQAPRGIVVAAAVAAAASPQHAACPPPARGCVCVARAGRLGLGGRSGGDGRSPGRRPGRSWAACLRGASSLRVARRRQQRRAARRRPPLRLVGAARAVERRRAALCAARDDGRRRPRLPAPVRRLLSCPVRPPLSGRRAAVREPPLARRPAAARAPLRLARRPPLQRLGGRAGGAVREARSLAARRQAGRRAELAGAVAGHHIRAPGAQSRARLRRRPEVRDSLRVIEHH
mmetsp:Transcript_22548/g.74366  ORF Transcript_22548/g.74366 Transcript_22548/m.74366 type:complete len:290 (-) Transcript_22548:174-1043(-)